MRIKNWKKFQHFKDRRPPWIKLHRDILDQRDIMLISPCSFKILACLWLLASEDETMQGRIPSIEDISFRIRIPESKIIESLPELTPWIDNLDITAISQRYQVGLPETETEAYKEEKEVKKPLVEYSTDFVSFWNEYPKKKAKGAAWQEWKKLKPPIQDVLKALDWQKESKQWIDGYVLDPERYIKKRCWEDEPQKLTGGISNDFTKRFLEGNSEDNGSFATV